MSDSAEQSAGPLSWRDVYRAVGESETRVVAAIAQAVAPLATALQDHEQRLGDVEDVQIGAQSSVNTARLFFAFGRWVVITIISLAGLYLAFGPK
jgi:hypothetical protein